jgi:hypothetical protein
MTQTTQITQDTPTLFVAKVGHRRFTAAVAYKPAENGWLVSDAKGTRKAAIHSLEAKLREAGSAIPQWTIVDKGDLSDATIHVAKEAVAETVEQPPAIPATEAAVLNPDAPDVDDEAETLRPLDAVADKAEEALEQAKAVATVPAIAPQMDAAGWVTPLTDKAAWIDIYEQCRNKLSGIEYPGEKRWEKIHNYRESVNVLMESIGFVGPWRRALGGTTWITFAGVVDDTVRQPRARNPFGPSYVKDSNGVWHEVARDKKDPRKIATESKTEDFSETLERARERLSETKTTETTTAPDAQETQDTQEAETMTEKRLTRAERSALNKAAHAAQRQAQKPAKFTGGTSQQRSAAYAQGRHYAGQAAALGHDRKTTTLWFKLGVVASLKAQGVPETHHYEAALVEAGYAEAIEQHAASMVGQAAAKAA